MTTTRTRREPPSFRRASVVDVVARSSRLLRLTLAGPELAGFDIGLPGSSVRVLVPDPAADGGPGRTLALPTWNGNEFLRADGTRPPIRTLTPVRFEAAIDALDVEVVLHGDGPLASWAASTPIGDPTAVSGTGRGYTIDPDARSFVLAGDESALPAITVLLRALPADAAVTVVVEAVEPVVTTRLPDHPGASVTWLGLGPAARPGDALAAAVAALELGPDTRVWAAGEAAGVHRLRQHLFEERGLDRSRAIVRGYWKVGRGGDADEA